MSAHVANNSGKADWGTPPQIAGAVREVFGGVIDLDPCSTDMNNKIIAAANYHTPEDDGLAQEWWGRCYLNPPYRRGEIDRWINKLLVHWKARELRAWIVLVNNFTETAIAQRLLADASIVCFPEGRIKFLDADLKPRNAPLQGQMICAAGVDRVLFRDVFEDFGTVLEVTHL